MRLMLEDFSLKPQQNTQKTKEEEYLKEIQRLKREVEEIKSNLLKEREIAYQQGLSEGMSKGYSLAKEEVEAQLKKIEEEKNNQLKETLKDYLVKIEDNIKNIQTSYKNVIAQTTEIISDSITDILEFLYLSEENKELVMRQIREILEEFFEYPKVYIRVGSQQLADILKARGLDVEFDERLKGLDFVMDFREFKIENNITEKLRIIKDEIKREIKKLSEV